ncbi:hypothetical protein [Polynucleobacter sphagniphilus]|uniref:hypothetical protein n=1 Tax=Polynucleobacter sphagniphilus TaxID=1743169 RepID=UPI002474A8A2|nr:hypothetical protein [Polynucleobacter sphagniphilus]MDH6525570.1 hypothetical protein [Polynucleobacter sphagniphilus]
MEILKNFNLLSDPYFSDRYASAYLHRLEGESLFSFIYSSGLEVFKSLSIKRPLPKEVSKLFEREYFDLQTAYGYGGYYSNSNDSNFIKSAVKALNERCQKESIIAEFIRFHPFNNISKFKEIELDFMSVDRQTVFIDLTKSKTQRWSEYSPTTRNILRKSELSLEIIETNDLDSFIRIYYEAMAKNNASTEYFFKRQYFEKLLAMPQVKLFCVRNATSIINMSFMMFGETIAHYHLSANVAEYVNLGGNYFLIDRLCDFIKEKFPNITGMHLGGGRTKSKEDSLFKFKKKFSKIETNFVIGGKIFNSNIYELACKNTMNVGNQFLSYRSSSSSSYLL